ncbi:MAG TPA: glycoside hydrolase family 15 protein [Candidatus Acidoferrales bacterium]|nr:glycoside hydrolase family 15 protein [Candidatus Acidoferrales bacterium]
MQHPIGEHALLADSRTSALVDPDGNVAWLCWPWVDSTPLLFSILDDQRGGGFAVHPAQRGSRVVSRGYHARSLVLETVWEVDGARLVVEDALGLGDDPQLVRRVRAEGGDIDVVVEFRAPQWDGRAARMTVAAETLEVTGETRVVIRVIRAGASWTAAAGGAVTTVSVTPAEPLTVTLGAPATDPQSESIGSTLATWQRMVPATLGASTPSVSELLGTTAAVLLGLRNRRGGIVAAPTTSLPQWPGSSRTWDYRYLWLRDASLAGVALLRLGLVGAAIDLGAFIGEVVTEHGPVPLLRVDGSAPPIESERRELAGYHGARPVRIGNAAAGQAQLDVPGEVLELASALAELQALPDPLAGAVPILATWLTDHWREPDNGIWEIRGMPRRYTHSLITAMSGLTGAAALADSGVVAGDPKRWRAAASAVAAALKGEGALELRLDGGGADAALAQLSLLGGLESLESRVPATLELIVARLDRGGLIDRYEGQPDTVDDPCAPFVFPTFWLSAAMRSRGADGSRWFEAALATRGPLGLFGEVADPRDHTPLGNYPQVQSHAAFAMAVMADRERR